jgi:hypothetical protein
MKELFLLGIVLVLPSVSIAQNYYYSQWTRNLVAGDNTFDITTGTTNTNWTTGIQAITPELLSNSVTVYNGTAVISLGIRKLSTTQFIVNSGSAISNAFITAQYPGSVITPPVTCVAPTLISAVRSTTDATQTTITWNSNGMTFGTMACEYSTDNGTTWILNQHGNSISPRIFTIPCNANTQVRLRGYSLNCPTSILSNILSINCTVSNSFTIHSTQAIGNAIANPRTNTCSDICTTFGVSNLCVGLAPGVNVSLPLPIGTQLYIRDNSGNNVFATQTACSSFFNNNNNCVAGGCSIATGIRYIRFSVSANHSNIIYSVNPSNGTITGVWGTCP